MLKKKKVEKTMFDRRIQEHFDWGLFPSDPLNINIGSINLNSGSAANGQDYQWKQLG